MTKRALISVFDKTDLIPFAKGLVEKNFEIYSSGGTLKFLSENGIEVHSVESLTQFPEILDGRVKTLHPHVHAGILADVTNEKHLQQLAELNISPFQLVAVNLYPFKEKLALNLSDDEMVKWIDVGGPTMLRAAAKNYKNVFVVSHSQDYEKTLEYIGQDLSSSLDFRKYLAARVFASLSGYDGLIADFLSKGNDDISEKNIPLSNKISLRYGENPHQKAWMFNTYAEDGAWQNYTQVQGKELSFNNIRDVDVTWKVASEFDEEKICVATKHSSPCGVALGETLEEAYAKVLECDNQSIFGGVVAFNSEVDENLAQKLCEIFLEVIIAPSFTDGALKIFEKKKNLRVLVFHTKSSNPYTTIKIDGGYLLQETDKEVYTDLEVKTKAQPSEEDMKNGIFGLKVIKYVKSNAILTVQNLMTTGIDGGQVNRFFAAENALNRAQGKNAILISDGFFPFSDVVNLAAEKGVKTIFQPGGSIKDGDSIKACDEKGIAMVFTGMRHFNH